jgi:prepilin-type N-terminal cleavage/methylation domain-containing protein
MGGGKAFTLIEVMIAIAVMAILLAGFSVGAINQRWFQHEANYRFAVRNGRFQLQQARQSRFRDLPPQQVVPGADGWVQLGQTDLVPGSVQVLKGGHRVVQVDERAGRVKLSGGAGQAVLNYSFFAPDQGEAHTVSSAGTLRLSNLPVVRIVRVEQASGDQLRELKDYQLDASAGILTVAPGLAGSVVRVTYLGGALRNQVSGEFLDAQLHSSLAPGPFKWVRVEESYGYRHASKLSLAVLKAEAP